MKITDVRSFRLAGPPPYDPKMFWEERLVQPVDIYSKWREKEPSYSIPEPFYQSFLEIVSDEDASGIYGPVSDDVLRIILNNLRPYLLGEDPFATEKLWDLMYRSQVHGRKGEAMFAISAVDIALWDLKGKAVGQPVTRLLGGPTRELIPAYASTLGRSLKPEAVADACREYAEDGYTAMKWFFRHGPGSGPKGFESNLELVKTIRDTVGYGIDLMLDCWMSWTVPYALRMSKSLERYEPRWLEEPLLPDEIDGYAELNRLSSIPISGGEHEYTRWGMRELLKRKAVSVLQPDVTWCGGITETVKICNLASAEGVPVVPHAGWSEPGLSVIFSQAEPVCPLVEYLVKWGVLQQHFLGQHKPEKGYYRPLTAPGVGYVPEMEKRI
jgi:L-alanine-DL-glutamate epimerase-like enolase superfamily enzyme